MPHIRKTICKLVRGFIEIQYFDTMSVVLEEIYETFFRILKKKNKLLFASSS